MENGEKRPQQQQYHVPSIDVESKTNNRTDIVASFKKEKWLQPPFTRLGSTVGDNLFFYWAKQPADNVRLRVAEKRIYYARQICSNAHVHVGEQHTREKERERERERAGVGYVLGFGAPFEAKRRERNFSVFEVLSFIENSAPNKERFTPPFSETQFNNLVNDLMKMITF